MKRILILLLLFFCSFNIPAQTNDSLIKFTDHLKWDFFKGIPIDDTLGARISTSIRLEISRVNIWNGLIYFKAYALMDPYRSWVKPSYLDQYTLQHEQTHFNITEACARKLQAELNKMRIKSEKSDLIQYTFNKWQNTLEVLQKQYDLETAGGNNHTVQKKWNGKSLEELVRNTL